MLESNNIISVLMAILPAFLYSYLIFKLIPHRYVSARRLRMYLVTGMLSPALVMLFTYTFPGWGTPFIVPSFKLLMMVAFIQVGLLEEMTKFTTFFWVSSQRRNSHYDLPIATMYYCLMTSTAFSIIENIRYLMNFGDQVLFLRGITAILTHMICGVMMGYFIAKARTFKRVILVEKFNDKVSLFDESAELNGRINRVKYTLYAISCAAFFHGIYDLNLFLPHNTHVSFTTFVILVAGLAIGNFMIKELIRESVEMRKKNYYKDLEHNKYH